MCQVRVLLTGNDALTRYGLLRVLERAPGIHVLGVIQSGEDVDRVVGEVRPDVVLLDLRLKSALTADLIDRLHDQHAGVRIIILINGVDPHAVYECIARGIAAVVTRDEADETYAEAVRAAAAQEPLYVSPLAGQLLTSAIGVGPYRSRLTPQEVVLLKMAARGLRNEQIAEAMRLHPGTVRNHFSSIYRKLEVHTRAEAVAWAWRSGIIVVREAE